MVTAIVLSGGTGSRMGLDEPKQYVKVADRTIISYSIETLSKSDFIDAIWIVAAEEFFPLLEEELGKYDVNEKFKGFSKPGETRQLSIYQGLNDVMTFCEETDYVFIHDAARPLLSAGMIAGCISAVKDHDGVMPAIPMKDTVYLSEDGKSISGLLDRNQVLAGQAPELFILGKYLRANESLKEVGQLEAIKGSSEPAVMAGMDIAVIPGEESNFKITTLEDLKRFEEIIKMNRGRL